jgi:predicted methyltransferase
MIKRWTHLAAVVSLGFAAVPGMAHADPVSAAVADSTRPQADRDKDASRNPVAMLAFAQIKPGDHAIDVWTGSGYWARLFGKVVGDQGHVLAYVPSEVTQFKANAVDVARAIGTEPGRGNIEAVSDPAAAMPPAQYFNMYDVIWIFENYHDLHNKMFPANTPGDFLKGVVALLKPGGVFVVVDHADAPGTGFAHTSDLHRIDPAALRKEVEAAGLVFDGQSDVLANSADPHTANVFDASIRGKTDRFAYRFRKPKS